MKVWLAKKVLGGITEKVMKAREIKRLRDYVEKDNDLDIKVKSLIERIETKENVNNIQLEQLYKLINKQGQYIETLEKEMAILKKFKKYVDKLIKEE
tara:strand:- start:646 stop:936 length:291 start_codon:yes stop_codon:yes gene_type:complete